LKQDVHVSQHDLKELAANRAKERRGKNRKKGANCGLLRGRCKAAISVFYSTGRKKEKRKNRGGERAKQVKEKKKSLQGRKRKKRGS